MGCCRRQGFSFYLDNHCQKLVFFVVVLICSAYVIVTAWSIRLGLWTLHQYQLSTGQMVSSLHQQDVDLVFGRHSSMLSMLSMNRQVNTLAAIVNSGCIRCIIAPCTSHHPAHYPLCHTVRLLYCVPKFAYKNW